MSNKTSKIAVSKTAVVNNKPAISKRIIVSVKPSKKAVARKEAVKVVSKKAAIKKEVKEAKKAAKKVTRAPKVFDANKMMPRVKAEQLISMLLFLKKYSSNGGAAWTKVSEVKKPEIIKEIDSIEVKLINYGMLTKDGRFLNKTAYKAVPAYLEAFEAYNAAK